MRLDPTFGEAEPAAFPGKISRRLSGIMGVLFLLVLVGGGIALYLAYSIYLDSEEISRERERIDLIDEMHSTVHHFVSALHRAIIMRAGLPSPERTAYIKELNRLAELYRQSGGIDKNAEEKIPFIIGDLASVSEKLARQPAEIRLVPQDLERLNEAEETIITLSHRLSALHRARIEQRVTESRRNIRFILAFYGGVVFLGVLLILAFSLFSYLKIARPLQKLVVSASEIAKGNFDQKAVVTSKDEIGQLSNAFNVMLKQLKEYQERLQGMATLEERERLAQELHDSIAQDLALLHFQLIQAETSLSSMNSTQTKEALREMRQVADQAYEDVRQAIFGLRTMVSKGLGLIPTLTEYLHEFSEMRKIPVDLMVRDPEATTFSLQAQIQLIRIIHEALANVFKHAQATKATVKFERDGDFATITIEDDGKGFVAERAMGKGFHFGLQTMRERADGVAGKLSIDSAPGKGTRVIVRLPIGAPPYETHSAVAGR